VSLRTRILLLALFAMVTPMVVLTIFLARDRQEDVAEARRQLAITAQRIARDLGDVVRATGQLHYGLSRAQDLDVGDRTACSNFLAGVLEEFPQYTGILTIRPDGSLFCDSLLTGRTLALADRNYFRSALASKDLAVEPVFGRLTGIAVLQIAHAARDDHGAARFVLLASLNLERYMQARYGGVGFASTVLALMDQGGTVLTWHPGGAALSGTSLGGTPLHLLAQGREKSLSYGEIAVGGEYRVWEAARLTGFPQAGLSVLIGVPADSLTAAADRRMLRALAILAAVSLVLFAGLWALAEWGIRRPTLRITAAVMRIRSGDLRARMGAPYPRGELGALASALDAAADRLEAQHAEIRRLNEGLEQRVAERTAEIARKNEELERANRAKSTFLANMSHELRTPLNSIIGFAEMLKDDTSSGLDEKRRGFVMDIFHSGTHLLALINDILDLSKVEAGRMQFEPEPQDIGALIQASVAVVRGKATTSGIHLDVDVDAMGVVQADGRKVKQILYNLLANAVRFTPDGGVVTLRARRCARSEVALDATRPGRLLPLPPSAVSEFIAISVEDTGIGIGEHDLARLFEPFTQLDDSASRHQGGTGLGLSLVRRFAELHGGTVGVSSRLGAGSRFWVWLPC